MRITALIPVYNASEYIDECLQSVLKQTRPVDEVIVVDDCSTDKTQDVVAHYPAVRFFSTERNSGHATARNVGIAKTSGDIIAWLDADDFWDVDHVQTGLRLFEDHSEAAVAFSRVRYVGARSGSWIVPHYGHAQGAIDDCFRGTVVPAMSCFTRREAVCRAGGFDERIRVAPDFEFWLRMSMECKFVSTDRITSNWRWHSGQISQNPLMQQRSVYLSRARFVEGLNSAGKSRHAQHFLSIWRDVYRDDLATAWYRRDFDALTFLLGFQETVQPDRSELRHRVLRAKIPRWVVNGYDYLLSSRSRGRA